MHELRSTITHVWSPFPDHRERPVKTHLKPIRNIIPATSMLIYHLVSSPAWSSSWSLAAASSESPSRSGVPPGTPWTHHCIRSQFRFTWGRLHLDLWTYLSPLRSVWKTRSTWSGCMDHTTPPPRLGDRCILGDLVPDAALERKELRTEDDLQTVKDKTVVSVAKKARICEILFVGHEWVFHLFSHILTGHKKYSIAQQINIQTVVCVFVFAWVQVVYAVVMSISPQRSCWEGGVLLTQITTLIYATDLEHLTEEGTRLDKGLIAVLKKVWEAHDKSAKATHKGA